MKGGASPKISKVDKGKTLVEQGDHGHELFLLLDGVLGVEVGGEKLVDLGPGAVLGERALVEGGSRTATLRAVTPCRVAVVTGDQIDPAKLAELAGGHRREERAAQATD
jgi:CRP-like cAMP-binding protein